MVGNPVTWMGHCRRTCVRPYSFFLWKAWVCLCLRISSWLWSRPILFETFMFSPLWSRSWTCMDLSSAKESLITDLMPEKTYEASGINWTQQMLVPRTQPPLFSPCHLNPLLALPFRNFCKCHTGPQSAGLSTSTWMSDNICTLSTHSSFHILPLPLMPGYFSGGIGRLFSSSSSFKPRSCDFRFRRSFWGVKAQTKAPGGGSIDLHQSRSLASKPDKHMSEQAKDG